MPYYLQEIGQGAFSGCTALSISVYEGTASAAYCANEGLTVIVLPDPYANFVMEGTTVVGYNGSSSTVIIPEGVTAIGENAFASNKQITKVSLPDTLETIGDWAFDYCERLQEINLPSKVTYLGIGALGGTKISEITIPEGVTELSNALFCDCASLKKVHLHEGITKIDDYAFTFCVKLFLILSFTLPFTFIYSSADLIGSFTFPFSKSSSP